MAIVSGVFGLLGVVTGAGISWVLNKRENKLGTTFRLHEEFLSPTISEARTQADIILKDNYQSGIGNLHELLGKDANSIWIVMGFYERLYAAINYKRVDERIAADLFGEIFFYWYVVFFKEQLKNVPWGQKHKLAALERWFISKAKKSSLQSWRNRANEAAADLRALSNARKTQPE